MKPWTARRELINMDKTRIFFAFIGIVFMSLGAILLIFRKFFDSILFGSVYIIGPCILGFGIFLFVGVLFCYEESEEAKT